MGLHPTLLPAALSGLKTICQYEVKTLYNNKLKQCPCAFASLREKKQSNVNPVNPGTYAPQRGNPVKKDQQCPERTPFRHSVFPSFRHSPAARRDAVALPFQSAPLSAIPFFRHSVIPLRLGGTPSPYLSRAHPFPSFRFSVIPSFPCAVALPFRH